MKTTLSFLPLVSAASLPGLLIAESFGAQLPAFLTSLHAFCAFVASTILVLAFRDYSAKQRSSSALVAQVQEKAAHPLAA